LFSTLAGADPQEINPHNLAGWLKKLLPAPNKPARELVSGARFGSMKTDKGCYRHDANIREVHTLIGDHDAGLMLPEQAIEHLAKIGIDATVATTASHTPEHPRWHVYVPLGQARTVEEAHGFNTHQS
jgi:hypothetical protein